MDVIEKRLEEDTELKPRTNLNVGEKIELLKYVVKPHISVTKNKQNLALLYGEAAVSPRSGW